MVAANAKKLLTINKLSVFKAVPPESIEKYNIHYSDYYNTGGFKFIPDSKVFEDIDSVNEVVYAEIIKKE